MPIVSVRIPQIGEGLQEARLVAVLKQPGDKVRRDEPIYQMETDKAVMDVESPYEGILTEWTAEPDTLLPIGGEIAKMDVAEGTQEMAAGHGPAPAPAATASSAAASNVATVRIPQIGEGLQEARLVAVLKQPGDMIKRDEPIYQMETDKAVMDVESPYEGKLLEWLAPVDTLLQIGAAVATMQVDQPVVDTPVHGAPAAPVAQAPTSAPSMPAMGGDRRRDVPPRTRAYAKEKGISDDQLAMIPAQGGKLMPADIDAFLAGSAPAAKPSGNFDERPLGQKQRLLASRLQRGSQLVVPGTITVATKWGAIEAARAKIKASGSDFQPSAFTMFAFAVARALADFPIFRSTLVGDSVLRTYRHANLGIAVALPGDELVLAVVNDADTLDWQKFAAASRAQIELARQGTDQANESVTISLTNMQSFGLRDAAPVVVPPSIATLFLGEPYNGLAQDTTELAICRYVNLALTFDHRLVNGVGAADFINAVKKNVETIDQVIGG
jgi:pyruvate dehydrogenase E2 component (dihydrolipoamide acetyltransferase)